MESGNSLPSIQNPRQFYLSRLRYPPPCFVKSHFNIIFLSTPRCSKWSLFFRISHQKPVGIFPFRTCHMPRPSHCTWLYYSNNTWFFLLWRCDPTLVMASSFLRFLDHTQRRTTVGRTPLDEWWARRRDLYLTTHDTHNRQISIPPVGFEPTISAGEWPQTYALDRAATGNGNNTW